MPVPKLNVQLILYPHDTDCGRHIRAGKRSHDRPKGSCFDWSWLGDAVPLSLFTGPCGNVLANTRRGESLEHTKAGVRQLRRLLSTQYLFCYEEPWNDKDLALHRGLQCFICPLKLMWDVDHHF